MLCMRMSMRCRACLFVNPLLRKGFQAQFSIAKCALPTMRWSSIACFRARIVPSPLSLGGPFRLRLTLAARRDPRRCRPWPSYCRAQCRPMRTLLLAGRWGSRARIARVGVVAVDQKVLPSA